MLQGQGRNSELQVHARCRGQRSSIALSVPLQSSADGRDRCYVGQHRNRMLAAPLPLKPGLLPVALGFAPSPTDRYLMAHQALRRVLASTNLLMSLFISSRLVSLDGRDMDDGGCHPHIVISWRAPGKLPRKAAPANTEPWPAFSANNMRGVAHHCSSPLAVPSKARTCCWRLAARMPHAADLWNSAYSLYAMGLHVNSLGTWLGTR